MFQLFANDDITLNNNLSFAEHHQNLDKFKINNINSIYCLRSLIGNLSRIIQNQPINIHIWLN